MNKREFIMRCRMVANSYSKRAVELSRAGDEGSARDVLMLEARLRFAIAPRQALRSRLSSLSAPRLLAAVTKAGVICFLAGPGASP
jgi:hypothetical protein